MSRGTPTQCPRCGAIIRSAFINTATIDIQGDAVPDLDSVCITLYPCGDMACTGDSMYQAFIDAFKRAYGLP